MKRRKSTEIWFYNEHQGMFSNCPITTIKVKDETVGNDPMETIKRGRRKQKSASNIVSLI